MTMFLSMLTSVSKTSAVGGLVGVMLFSLICSCIYLLPSIVALAKRNHRTRVILLNIFLGWFIVIWILCLVWAFKRDTEVPAILTAQISPADELKKYKELLDSGVISEEEFEEKKAQLLNL